MHSDPSVESESDLGTLLQTQVLDALDEIYYLLSPNGNLVEWNDSIPEITGYSNDDIAEMSALEFFREEHRERVGEAIATVVAEGRQETVEADLVTKDGRTHPYEFSGTPVFEDGQVAGIVGIGRDISDLREQQRRLRTVTDNVPIVLFALDSDGRFIFSRGRGYRAMGMDPEEVVGESVCDIYADEPEILADIDRALAGEEFRRVNELGSKVFEIWYQPIIDGDQVDQVVGVARDITDRFEKERQLELQTNQLEVLNRMVQHDIKNDLMVLLAWARDVAAGLDESERESLQRVIDAGEHIRELTETSQDYMEIITGDETIETHPIQLVPIIEDEVDRRRSMFESAVFKIDRPGEDVRVEGNEMLATVFRNLLNNAVQHNDTDEPTVETTVEPLDETVRVTVADDGPGVSDQQKTEIFGKGDRGLESDGTGIGLYLVHTLVTELGGDVWVEDNDPRGARFIVELDRLDTA